MDKKYAPILITGVFRSGTTLITQMLKNHSNISLTYDSVNYFRFCFDKYNPISDKLNAKRLVSDLANRIGLRWGIKFNDTKIIDQLKHQQVTYASLYDLIMKDILLKNSDKQIWGEKTTLVWTKIDDFLRMFPYGRVIHIFRDPRAIVDSWKTFTNAPGKDYLDAIFNCKSSMEYVAHQTKDYKNKRFHALKFENLVQNPEAEMMKICEKLEIDFEYEMLDSDKFIDKKGEKWNNNSKKNNELRGISKKPISIWKENLAKWEIWLIEKLLSDQMTLCGYDLENFQISNQEIEGVMDYFHQSKLLRNGVLTYLFKNQGVERFPSDPFDSKTWEEETVK